MTSVQYYDSPLGRIRMAADEIGLTGYAGGIDRKSSLLELETALSISRKIKN